MIFRLITIICLLIFSGMAETSLDQLQQEPRIALVIGNGDYDDSPLANAVTRAQQMRDFLKQHRFEVIYAEEATKRDLVKLLRNFSSKITPNSLALFYYNGHMIQHHGKNLLIPLEASIAHEQHIAYETIELDLLLSIMEKAQSRLNIVMLDSAYVAPLGKRYKPEKAGLAPIDKTKRFHFILAKQPYWMTSSTAFVPAFIKTFSNKGMEMPEGMRLLYNQFEGANRPWFMQDESERFFFHLPDTLTPKDTLAWEDAKHKNTLDAYQHFIKTFPKSRHRAQAQSKVSVLLEKQKEAEALKAAREHALARQKQIEAYKNVLKTRGIELIEPETVQIHSGVFTMGSEQYDTAQPLHKVTISKTFHMAKCEITNKEFSQYLKAINKLPADDTTWDNDRPAVGVSWQQANNYAQWLSRYTGKTYRLPTESEWEYVARAGTKTLYYWGNSESSASDHAWMQTNAEGTTHPCATKKPNAWGVYDMAGNAWEWCADDATHDYADAPGDGTATHTDAGKKVLRGGGWESGDLTLSPAYRRFETMQYQSTATGFRLVREDM